MAALILCGAQLVTATLWSLPTAAGYRQFVPSSVDPMRIRWPMRSWPSTVPMTTPTRGSAVNRWQREQMRRWRDGDLTASPLYWAALVTFAVDGAR